MKIKLLVGTMFVVSTVLACSGQVLADQHSLDVPQVTLLAHELRKEGLPLPECILTREELVSELVKLKNGGYVYGR